MYERDIVTIFGGNGFIGRYLVKILAKTGAKINIVTRKVRVSQNDLALCGYAGQIANIKFSDSREKLNSIIEGSTYVVNLIGTLSSSEKELEYANAAIPRKIAEAVKRCDTIKRFVHISAMGHDHKMKSKYIKSKIKGEKAVLHEYPDAIILRPSVIIGDKDNFINLFIQLAKFSPIVPIIGNAKSKLQPIYVKDVAQCIYNALTFNDSSAVCGHLISLAGDHQYTIREILDIAFKCTNQKRIMMEIPAWILYIGAIVFEIFNTKTFTTEHLYLLKINNTLQKQQNGATMLHAEPTPIQYALSSYL